MVNGEDIKNSDATVQLDTRHVPSVRDRERRRLASAINLSTTDRHLSQSVTGTSTMLTMWQNAISGLCRNNVNMLPFWCWSATVHVHHAMHVCTTTKKAASWLIQLCCSNNTTSPCPQIAATKFGRNVIKTLTKTQRFTVKVDEWTKTGIPLLICSAELENTHELTFFRLHTC